jgi:hypothetical protein
MRSASNGHSSQELWSKLSKQFSCHAQKNLNNSGDTGGPVVSHIITISKWLFSVGKGRISHEIWLNMFRGSAAM